MATADSDKRLIQRTLAGERDAFGILVERYGPLVRGLILEKTRRPYEVEDLVQETFSKAYEQLSTLRKRGQFAAWLRRIAGNQALDWLRAREVCQREDVTAEIVALYDPVRSPGDVVEQNDTFAKVWEAIDHLLPELRQVIVLHYMEGCSQRVIARFLGVSPAAVQWRLFRARTRLGEALSASMLRDMVRDDGNARARREKIVAALPLLAFFRPPRPWRVWAWRGLVGVTGVTLTWLLGTALPGEWQILSDISLADEVAPAYRTVDLVDWEAPGVSVMWEPARPQRGDQLHVVAAGPEIAAAGAATLHYLTDPWAPVDRTVVMHREEDTWVAEVHVPGDAATMFMHVTAGQEDPQTFGHWPAHATTRHLRQYDRGLAVCGPHGRPLRNAAYNLATMAEISQRPPEAIMGHLGRELARYPDNIAAHKMRWLYQHWSAGPERQGETWKRTWDGIEAELAGLTARAANRPEMLWDLSMMAMYRTAKTDRREKVALYRDFRSRFPENEHAAEAAWQEAMCHRFSGDTMAYGQALQTLTRTYPRSPFAGYAYMDLLSLLRSTKPDRAKGLADSLISGSLVVPYSAQAEVEEGHGRYGRLRGMQPASMGYTVRFELYQEEGHTDSARALAGRLIGSGLPNAAAYRWVGEQLFEREGATSLASSVLEAGLLWAEVDLLITLPGFAGARAWARSEQSASKARAEMARHWRAEYLLLAGTIGLEQSRYARAVEYLEETVRLQSSLTMFDPDDAAYMLLGEALEHMGDWQRAVEAYLAAVRVWHSHPEAEVAIYRLYEEHEGSTSGARQVLEETYVPAPDFSLVATDGREVRLSDFAAKPVLIRDRPGFYDNTIEDMVGWHREFGDALAVLLVTYWAPGLNNRQPLFVPEQWRTLAEKHRSEVEILIDDGTLQEEYGLPMGPSVLVIDHLGRLRLRQTWMGAPSDDRDRQLREKLREVVAEYRQHVSDLQSTDEVRGRVSGL